MVNHSRSIIIRFIPSWSLVLTLTAITFFSLKYIFFRRREQGSTLTANSGFVTNIQFGSLSLERGRVGAVGRRVPRQAMDSIVTGSLLSLTRPREERRRGPGKLSSYVLEEEGRRGNEVIGDDREADEFDTKELSATVLDKGGEITSLYRWVGLESDIDFSCRTISRKRLLRQYKDFQIPEGEEEDSAMRIPLGETAR